jgi:hypothetical protein
MPRETGEVVFGDIVAKIVEQEERIEFVGGAEAKGSAEVDAGAFEGRFGLDEFFYRTN